MAGADPVYNPLHLMSPPPPKLGLRLLAVPMKRAEGSRGKKLVTRAEHRQDRNLQVSSLRCPNWNDSQPQKPLVS